MHQTMKLCLAAASAVALAASPAMAFQGNQSGWTGQSPGEYGYHHGDQHHRSDYGSPYRHRDGYGQYGYNTFSHNDREPQGLKGPRYGRDGYTNFANGPYRNPSANNWHGGHQ